MSDTETDETEQGFVRRGEELWFYSQVDTTSALRLITELQRFRQRPRLVLHLLSEGGELTPSYAIHDVLRSLTKTHKTVIVEGVCSSAAVLILFAADRRLMTKNAELMVHHVFAEVEATKLTKAALDSNVRRLSQCHNKFRSLVQSSTTLPVERLEELMECETYLSAEEARDLGFIDAIA